MNTDGQPRAESPLHLAAPTIPTARPLNASAKALLILSACAMIALCYLFSLAAMTVIVLFLAVELVIFVALLRFGMIGIITPVMERHGGLLTLFARSLWLRKGEHGRVPLNRDEAPRLFSILDSLAGRLGIAVPREVVVEMNVGAWVELRGWRQGSKATRLGIGYDLLAGLTEAEVEAVLAHEMAHARLVRRGLRTWLGGGFARIANLTNQLPGRRISAVPKNPSPPARFVWPAPMPAPVSPPNSSPPIRARMNSRPTSVPPNSAARLPSGLPWANSTACPRARPVSDGTSAWQNSSRATATPPGFSKNSPRKPPPPAINPTRPPPTRIPRTPPFPTALPPFHSPMAPRPTRPPPSDLSSMPTLSPVTSSPRSNARRRSRSPATQGASRLRPQNPLRRRHPSPANAGDVYPARLGGFRLHGVR